MDTTKDEPHELLRVDFQYLIFATSFPPMRNHEDGVEDSSNPDRYTSPLKWSKSHKMFMTWLGCIATLVTAYCPGAYTAGLDQYGAIWHLDSTSLLLGITVFNMFFAVSPMILAPLSELQGRRPVFVAAGIVFVISQLCSGLTASYAGMLVTRALAGASSAVFSTMVGGVVSDLYEAADRNTPMVFFTGASLCGAGIGPLVSSIVAQHMSWRWIYYVQIITCGLVVASFIVFFDETRGSVILSRKAKALNSYYDEREKLGLEGPVESLATGETVRVRWKVKEDEDRATLIKLIKTSLMRPFRLLFTESVVFCVSLWMSFVGSILFLTFEAVPLAFWANHRFDTQQNGLVFISLSVAAVLSSIRAVYVDHVSRRKGRSSNPRAATLPRLRSEHITAPRPLLVRMDPLPVHPLDRSRTRRGMHYDGDLFRLPRCLQLPCRYASCLRQLCARCPILLSQCAFSCPSALHRSDVQRVDLSGWV